MIADEELIYRITRAVYGRLGAGADERTVEGLVTDIYRAIEPVAVAANKTARAAESGQAGDGLGLDAGAVPLSAATASREEGSAERMVVSVFGVDRPGIVAAVAQILAEAECSIADINQTVVQGKFAMVLIANSARARQSAAELKERFRREGERLGVRIYAQREDLFNAMHRI
ncbi:MAG: ACT domain-containing protein [Acidobacteriota bacterium]|nr:ACT domain-containing protein [Acidobacteriota bacterium]